MNPEERAQSHPVNPFVTRAEADRMLAEAFTLPTTQVRAVDVAQPTDLPVRHRRESRDGTVRGVVVTAGVVVSAYAAVHMGIFAGLEYIGGGW